MRALQRCCCRLFRFQPLRRTRRSSPCRPRDQPAIRVLQARLTTKIRLCALPHPAPRQPRPRLLQLPLPPVRRARWQPRQGPPRPLYSRRAEMLRRRPAAPRRFPPPLLRRALPWFRRASRPQRPRLLPRCHNPPQPPPTALPCRKLSTARQHRRLADTGHGLPRLQGFLRRCSGCCGGAAAHGRRCRNSKHRWFPDPHLRRQPSRSNRPRPNRNGPLRFRRRSPLPLGPTLP